MINNFKFDIVSKIFLNFLLDIFLACIFFSLTYGISYLFDNVLTVFFNDSPFIKDIAIWITNIMKLLALILFLIFLFTSFVRSIKSLMNLRNE